jgi:ribosomal protein L14
VEPPRLEYKGFKYKYKIKGDIVKSIIVRVNRSLRKKDSCSIRVRDNSVILINKKFNITSKFMNGITLRSAKRKKLIILFKKNL